MYSLRRRSRRWIPLASPFLGCLFLYYLFAVHSLPHAFFSQTLVLDQQGRSDSDNELRCPPLPGIENVLVVMKTGVTEALEKVPVHFNTTLKCIPNYVIFSDFEEDVAGVHVHDVLRNIDPVVKQTNPDFEIYNRLQKQGRQGLRPFDLRDDANTPTGKPNNPGWKLDKWKFLPMVDEALSVKPDAKWYVFMEADTYIFWANLMQWLSKLDARQPHYLGTETQIADVIFAHGGSGFMLSNPAMRRAADQRAAHASELDEFVNIHWAGDCVLGKVLADAGVPLRFTWPLLQNSRLAEVDTLTTDFYRKPWCFPAIGYHHMSPEEIEFMWQFEQLRYRKTNDALLLHSDIFREVIHPQIELENPRSDWDNLSGEEHPTSNSFENCKIRCQKDLHCFQYSWRDDRCYTSKTPKLGMNSVGAQSAWMSDRINNTIKRMGTCRKVDWGL
ncbi:hypothetical protein Plec18167_007494 [Paecilomyces lecythidis]|uniref:N-acetylgalactosaminide beta-1,3-galactosyltransferase n=1 Tax=Paecilomyces lecythidis TaxID=3004212 RepID=A0ABR3X3U9_9EURO